MTAGARGSTPAARLARLGFADPARAERDLAALHVDDDTVSDLADTADPDLAVRALARLVDAAPDREQLLSTLRASVEVRHRLFAVLGASAALGEHLVRHPDHWQVLAPADTALLRPTRLALDTELADAVQGGTGTDALDRLRIGYRRRLLGLAARDLAGELAVEDVAGELADLAAAALAAALTLAQRGHSDDDSRLAVVAMGKCGGRELNYASDVDVVFVADPATPDHDRALLGATRVATALMRACSDVTPEGALWPVDAGLRPEGRDGPLVRTLASCAAYYQRWAKTWEFQALLKAWPVAGDPEVGRRFVDLVDPMVWTAADRADFVDDVRAMRRRVERHVPGPESARELKLGPGGLRDVEFAVQLLQLVHGRVDPKLRSRTTLVALDALAAGGYVGRHDAAQLAAAYRFLRSTEHRLQLHRLRRTHLLPTDEAGLRRLARSLGYRRDPVVEFGRDHDAHVREVRRLHEKLFYRPLLTAVARLPAGESALTPSAAGRRLVALGYADPDAALRHLAALTAGVSRRASIQRTLLPVMLGWFADAPDPDAGLLAFRQVSEALGRTPWYLRLLRDEGVVAERLARLLAASRLVSDLLLRAPEAVALLADDRELAPVDRVVLAGEMQAAIGRTGDSETAVAVVRGIRRRELFRLGSADLLGRLPLADVGRALTDVTAATVAAALATACREIAADRPDGQLPVRLAVVGMGRLGGAEQGYGSDADVLFVYEAIGPDDPGATRAAHDVAEEMRRLLALPAPDPPLRVDADLRPEGRQGPLVRSLGSYAEYYRRWSLGWEAQALLRATPLAGDADLGRRFGTLVDPIRYPAGGLTDGAVREIRRIKARVEAERLPRGADPALHLKLGRGGLADVEWTIQLLQLRAAHELPALRTTGTLPALRAARDAGLLTPADAETLTDAWTIATRIRNATMLVRGRPTDALPTDPRTLRAVAMVLGRQSGDGPRLVEEWRRVARRARTVVERVFYD
jgi:glutamate-ammonia-ligase adenylyltransferase